MDPINFRICLTHLASLAFQEIVSTMTQSMSIGRSGWELPGRADLTLTLEFWKIGCRWKARSDWTVSSVAIFANDCRDR
jgi:hypothetical protein